MCNANDAVMALAEHVAGTEEAFVGLMNERAKQPGLFPAHLRIALAFPLSPGFRRRTLQSSPQSFPNTAVFFQYSSIWLDTFCP